MGPIETLGYPNLPTNTLGGEAPSISRRSVLALVLVVEKNLASTGHLSFPHRSFEPLQKAHLEDLAETPSSESISSNMAELSTIADDLENCERSIQDVSTAPAFRRSAAAVL
jgi:hypothetical protein